MKLLIVASALLVSPLLAVAGSLPAVKTSSSGSEGDAYRPLVAAHRGGAMHRPENTLVAFRHALAIGSDILELDMVMTADDQLIVHHDANINPDICKPDAGSAVVAAPVRSMTAGQVQQFDCGSGIRDIYDVPGYQQAPGERVPTVDAVLQEFSASGALFYAETKMPGTVPGVADVDPLVFAHEVDALVRKYGLEERFVLQSSDYRTLSAMRQINPQITTCLLGAHRWEHRDFLKELRRQDAGCILLRDAVVDAAGVQRLQANGIQVYSEVIDKPSQWQRYVDLGVDVIFTNHPQGAIEFLKQQGLR